MALKLEEVKQYLRVDTSHEDEFIKKCMVIADNYVLSAITGYEEKSKDERFTVQAEIVKMALIQDMFDNRYFVNKDTDLSYTIRSMITQLQY